MCFNWPFCLNISKTVISISKKGLARAAIYRADLVVKMSGIGSSIHRLQLYKTRARVRVWVRLVRMEGNGINPNRFFEMLHTAIT